MTKTIFEEMGGTYTQVGDYFVPDLKLPEEETQPIGIWGQRRKHYLREHKRLFYSTLLTNGKLNSYLAEIDKQAGEMFSRIVKQMANSEGVTETLKAENQMEWVRCMNNIRNRAAEVVNSELIYDKQVEMGKKVNHHPTTNDIPKIFWRYFDLYRRKKITLYQYSESTGLSITDIEKFLKEITGKSAKIIEKTKQI